LLLALVAAAPTPSVGGVTFLLLLLLLLSKIFVVVSCRSTSYLPDEGWCTAHQLPDYYTEKPLSKQKQAPPPAAAPPSLFWFCSSYILTLFVLPRRLARAGLNHLLNEQRRGSRSPYRPQDCACTLFITS
jgi:hypothetical protein